MKQAAEPIAMLTAYDASFARVEDQAGVDVVLVGDSLGMVIQGHATTVPVSVDDIVYHCAAVSRGLDHALLLADMPFLSYRNEEQAVLNAGRMLQQGGAQMVKLEGGVAQIGVVEALVGQGIPVCAHLGLKPQSINKLGAYLVQGRDSEAADQMLREARQLEGAGADLLLLECVPAILAAEITKAVAIPVIGIGAGVKCDGQVLVLQDVLGITPGKPPKFSRNFMLGADSIAAAITAYVQAVKLRQFPKPEHQFE
ncbi:MAG: 3-methyl-2-oxobutanoate hydroxymethyltransferase [Gammaproteobacteria bacterium]|nr:3-methyl-2-oxobutanoate hydroxymethyltransferase [Gammaproteobacteria bacterium]MCP5136862.1 3-methyl-2-oxobutanoate hydroxymethyltransferase [Gammaproteobacteria bacterium]